MLWLALAVACSLAIAVIFKVTERRGLDRTAVLTANYAVAGALAAVLLGGEEDGFAPEPGLVALGVTTGLLFILGFYVFAYAIREAGMGLAAGVMRLSVVLPFLASWLVWGERPTPGQLAGLTLASAAFFLLARPAGEPGRPEPHDGGAPHGGGRTGAVLGLLFLAGGLVDVALKTFGEVFAPEHGHPVFLLFVFGVAFAAGLVLVAGVGLRRRRWPRGGALGWGAALGLVNYGSADFILRALAELRGTFVFPANNVAIVTGAALLGVVWGERLSRWNAIGLALAAVALLLLAPR